MLTIIQAFVYLLQAYFAAGFVFAVYFFVRGAFKMDPLITNSKWTVRLLLVPGAILMWPILSQRLMKK
jgi:hypothetical protein